MMRTKLSVGRCASLVLISNTMSLRLQVLCEVDGFCVKFGNVERPGCRVVNIAVCSSLVGGAGGGGGKRGGGGEGGWGGGEG